MKKSAVLLASCLIFTAALFALTTTFWIGSNGAGVAQAQQAVPPAPQYKVDVNWPKPLPRMKGADGNLHQWITGEVGGTCVDSHDHIFTLNRSWQNSSLGKMANFEGLSGIPAPPVIVYDPDGNVVTSWGDASLLTPDGGTKVMPESLHGCFADYEDNIWIGGNSDGIVQKYSHDGKLLLQIGAKGQCDGKADQSPKTFFTSCGETADGNSSKTLLNSPADIAVDPNPDPVSKERGSVYIADGYGNHRIVVFDGKGKYLRQWGSPGNGLGQFRATGGGHPHCVIIGRDDLVYVCDRGNQRIEVFDKMGAFKREIPINPEGLSYLSLRTNDIAFSPDQGQTYIHTSDVGSGSVWILNRMTGVIVSGIGSMGHNAGQFVGVHTMAMDSKGNLYVSEGGGGRRTQKFTRQ